MEKFVLSVLVDGKFQKEFSNGTTNVPFGAEYKLRLRNKNSRRAVAKVFIDGENVSGGGFIVLANQFIEIERPVDGNKKFKFVSLDSAEAIDFGKNGANDDKVKGVVEVRWHLEVEPGFLRNIYALPRHPWHVHIPNRFTPSGVGGKNVIDPLLSYSINSTAMGVAAPDFSARAKSLIEKNSTVPSELLQDGCTVEGNVSNDQYHTTHCSYEPEYVTTKVFLQGFNPDKVETTQHVASTTPTYRAPQRTQSSEYPAAAVPSEADRLTAENADLEARIAAALRNRNDALRQQLAALEAVSV